MTTTTILPPNAPEHLRRAEDLYNALTTPSRLVVDAAYEATIIYEHPWRTARQLSNPNTCDRLVALGILSPALENPANIWNRRYRMNCDSPMFSYLICKMFYKSLSEVD